MTSTSSLSSSSTQSVTYSGLSTGSGTATDKTSLGQDQFLQLLVTQMKNQDPSSPMDSSQIIEQTAQLSQVEQLTAQTTQQQTAYALQQKLAAAQMVGEKVTYTATDGTATTGTVTAASFAASTPTLTIGGKSVDLDSVTGVTTDAATTATAASTAASTAAAAAASTAASTVDKTA